MTNKLPFIPEEFHYAIANVAARASQLDHMIEHSIEVMFGDMHNTAEFILKRGMSGDRLTELWSIF